MLLLTVGTAAADDDTARPVLHLPDPPYSYTNDSLPAHFLTPAARTYDNTRETNRTTDAGATLGRVLFYDTRLSGNQSLSCASCHQQERAFSDPRRFLSGHQGQATDRNGMSLVNLRFTRPGFFWDARAATLEEQALIPIRSRIEMGQSLEKLPGVLASDPRYPELFEEAFGDPSITADRVARALAQFVRSMVSYRSRYDEGLAAAGSVEKPFANFSDGENRGKTVFFERCAICHTEGRGTQAAFFSMFSTLNNGIDRTGTELDAGSGDITLLPGDIGNFKPSDLRNVEFTAPYMHDGRFETLEQVVEHYSQGVNRHPNASGFIYRMNLSDSDRADLVAFLRTLSDPEFLTDPRFSDPWSRPDSKAAEPAESAAPAPSHPAGPELLLTPGERADRLAQGIGLPAADTLPWLNALDTDRSGALDHAELAPLAALLVRNGNPPRFDRRRFEAGTLRIARATSTAPALFAYDSNHDKQITADELPADRRYLLELGDTDADQAVNPAEARTLETLERFIAFQANDRDQARIGRIVQDLNLPEPDAQALLEKLAQIKQSHEQDRIRRDAEVVHALEAVLGPAGFGRFQRAMLARQDTRSLQNFIAQPTVEKSVAELLQFDGNRDGVLASDEQAALANVLNESPGGFGCKPTPMPTVDQVRDRFLSRATESDGWLNEQSVPERIWPLLSQADRNADQRLSPGEVESFLLARSFQSLIGEGVYLAGGFLNAFHRAERLLEDLNLDTATRARAAAVLKAHEQSTTAEIARAVEAACHALRAARRQAASTPSCSISN